MHKLFVLATLLVSALAQSASNGTSNHKCADGTSDGVSAAQDQPSVTVVEVGPNGTLTYSPEDIQVAPGSIVQFNFNPKNHTVTESSFAQPCVPLAANLTSTTRPGLRSGFVPVSPNDTDQAVFRILVNDTKPIWIFCGQKNPKPHCQAGMVMVINQNRSDTTDKTLQAFKNLAAAVPVASAASSASASSSLYLSSSSSASTPAATAVVPVTTPGPVLSASATATSNGTAVIATFAGRAVPTGQPARYAAAGAGVFAVAAAALL